MYNLKFVDRLGHVPHESFMLQCDSFKKKWVKVHAGETLEQHAPSWGETYWPLEEEMNLGPMKEAVTVLIVQVYGSKGYNWIAARHVILFVMNFDGKTIDKTIV